MTKKIRQLLSDETGGAELLEASFAVPIFALLLLAILGWSYFMFQMNIIQYATKQAARCAVIPRVNGNVLPWCGWQPSMTYQTYGLVNSYGLVNQPSAFSQDATATQTSGTISYKYTCIKALANNPLQFLANILVPHVAGGNSTHPPDPYPWSTHTPSSIQSSACRPIQAQ